MTDPKVAMPKSKVRKKNDFTVNPVSRTPVKVKAGPSSVWFVVLFVGLMLIGLVWLLVFQLAATNPTDAPLPDLDGRPGRVELRDRLCFHDRRSVAHDAVALSPNARRSAPRRACGFTVSAIVPAVNHTRVIHPHC